MPDPGWAARTPEANDLLLKAGTGVGTHLANQTAWTTLGASHHASGVASAINTAATAASWLGVGSAASALNVTMLNATLHGLAGWVDVKPAVVSTAIAAFETANAAMRPAPECMENRDEWGVDNAINPSVLWTLTPRIVSLDVEYFGVMWPNNAAALQEFFAGHGAQGFFDAQAQMLSGLQGLIETVGQHGTTTGHVLDNAIGTDQAIAGLF